MLDFWPKGCIVRTVNNKKEDFIMSVMFKRDAKEVEKLIFSVGYTLKRAKKHAVYEHPDAGLLVVAKTSGDLKCFKKQVISQIKKSFRINNLPEPSL